MNAPKDNDTVQIGWASRDVTPDRPVNLLGQFHIRISQGVKDPLTVMALAIAARNRAKVTVPPCIATAWARPTAKRWLRKHSSCWPTYGETHK